MEREEGGKRESSTPVPPGALTLCDIGESTVFGIRFSPGGPEGQFSGLFFLLDFHPAKHRWVVTMVRGQVALDLPGLNFFLFPHVLSFSLAIISHFIWPYTPHMSLAQRTKKHSITLKLGLATCRPPPLPQLGQALSFPMPCSGPLPLTLPFSTFTLELEPSCLQGRGGAWPGTLTAGWQLEEIHLFSALRVAPWKGPRTRGKGAGKSCEGGQGK